MIVVDSSALLAILFHEPKRQAFRDILSHEEHCIISAVNAHESACVLRTRIDQAAVEELWQLLEDNEIEIVPFDAARLRAAVTAYDRYGKGINPKAALNLCDCAAYALAKTKDAPLLFKGNDFVHTDLQAYVLG